MLDLAVTVHRLSIEHDRIWKASGDIDKRQRIANGAANRGSLFNVRRAVRHSPLRFLFILSYICSLCNVRLAIRRSPRRSPGHFQSFFPICYSRFAIQCSPRRLPFAVRHSPLAEPFAAPFAFQCPLTLSIVNILAIWGVLDPKMGTWTHCHAGSNPCSYLYDRVNIGVKTLHSEKI